MHDPNYTAIQYRATEEYIRFLRRLGAEARERGHAVGDKPIKILEWAVAHAARQLAGLEAPPRAAPQGGPRPIPPRGRKAKDRAG